MQVSAQQISFAVNGSGNARRSVRRCGLGDVAGGSSSSAAVAMVNVHQEHGHRSKVHHSAFEPLWQASQLQWICQEGSSMLSNRVYILHVDAR
jgi:hypothetical protein